MYEEWNVLTYRDYDFDDNGRKVKGRTLHCYRQSRNDGWPGVEYAKLTCPYGCDAYNVLPVPGKKYNLGFDRRGKVVHLELIA